MPDYAQFGLFSNIIKVSSIYSKGDNSVLKICGNLFFYYLSFSILKTLSYVSINKKERQDMRKLMSC